MGRIFSVALLVLALHPIQPVSAEPLFPNSSYSAGNSPIAVALADLNRDGIPDMAVVDEASEYVLVRLGQGDGTFGAEVQVLCGPGPTSIAAGDVDGDSVIDLVVTNTVDHEITTLSGRGDGTFRDPYVQAVAQYPTSVRLLDLDANGRLDIVVIDQAGPAIVILYSYGYQVRVPFNFDVSDVAAGDFNGDSLPDLVVIPAGIFINAGQGQFRFKDYLPGLHGPPTGAATGDFDGDGLVDLAVTDYFGSLNILHGLGDGTFSPGVAYPAGLHPSQPTVEDFDRDGRPDVLVINTGDYNRPGDLAYFRGRGDGTFDEALHLGRGLWPEDLSVADLNGDLRADLAVLSPATATVAVVLGNGTGPFITDTSLGFDQYPRGFRSTAIADFDGDGHVDLAVGEEFNLKVYRGGGDGTFGQPHDVTIGGASSSIGVGDLNGDGILDMAVTEGILGSNCLGVSILLGNGDTTFATAGEVQAGCQPVSVGLGDFNRDGKLDMAIGNRASSFGSILFGRGDGAFDPPLSLGMPEASGDYVAVGDFDGDGDDDVVFTHLLYNNSVSVFLSRGDGTFDPEMRFPVGDYSYSVVARDFNGDGKLDLATANYLSLDVSILLGRGDGTFGPDARFPAGMYPQFIAAGDFDGDGRDDLAVTGGTGTVTILLGRGDGTFSAAEQLTAVNAQGIASGDFNADGRSDLAIGAFPGAAVLLSQPPPDADGDGIPDRVDPCTDTDGDGFGDPGFKNNTCAPDNCPGSANPGQEDADGDGHGDVCDACPADRNNDEDHDGVCGDVDNCSFVYNPSQEPSPDEDGDGILDECDNCPTIANRDQADRELDGWGDACQPYLSILEIRQDGGTELEVTVLASDPQGESLSGEIGFIARDNIHLRNPGAGSLACDMDIFPHGRAGEGIGYYTKDGHPILFDVDALLGCNDGRQDFEIAAGEQQGHCSDAQTVFSPSIDLAELGFNQLLCVRRLGHPESEMELVIIDAGESSFEGQYFSHLVIPPFEGGLPSRTDISALTQGLVYDLDIGVTDGNTGMVGAGQSFLYQGERTMVLRSLSGPEARVSSPAEVECDAPRRGTVVLDGSASTPGAAGGTIASYEWFVDFGQPGQRFIGNGPILTIALPLGTSAVALRVTDANGSTASTQASITVRDTTAPAFELGLDRTRLWPPNHSMVPVHAAWSVLDLCDPSPAVTLVSVTSSEPDDAPGGGDGNTTMDVSGADVGLADEVFSLRAERLSTGSGRTYEIDYIARDASGNTSSSLAIVTVPHDLGSGPEPMLLRVSWTGGPGMMELYWNAVTGAQAYDVISGDLGSVRTDASRTSLGRVQVLARGTMGLSSTEGTDGRVPALGRALFYLVQYRDEKGGTGFGTESAPWPREPDSCEGGCPEGLP